jgi:hypothetical protein
MDNGLTISSGLLATQIINFVLLTIWIGLAVAALYKLSKLRLDSGVALGWAALIVLVPILGALAFLMWTPPNQPAQDTR